MRIDRLYAWASGPCARSLLLALLALTAAAPPARAQMAAPAGLIDVPYISQTEQLCGGAAVSMVLRYWGDRDVVPDDFAPLVERAAGGIRTSALVAAVRARGWQTFVLDAARADSLQTELARGRPLIALLEERPGVYHYVVLAGISQQAVVVHDPARSPYRLMTRAEFDRRSAAAGGWLLLVLPGATDSAATTSPSAAPASPTTTFGAPSPAPPAAARPLPARVTGATAADGGGQGPCDVAVARGVAEAASGALAEAERALVGAVMDCPTGATGWRELAGLRFVQKRYVESSDLASQAAALAPGDTEAWRLLGSARYLSDRLVDALEAWNRIGEPRIDLVNAVGLQRTRHPVVVALADLEPRHLLTPDAFRLAERRLGELPAAAATGIRYQPLPDGKAAIEMTIVERAMLPSWPLGVAALGVASGFRREISLDVASPTGDGEVWTGAYRWAHKRPRARFALSIPPRRGIPGVLEVDLFWERQSYATADGLISDPIRESRRHAGLHLGNWATPWLHWRIGGGTDRFETAHYAFADARIVTRWDGDRIALAGGVGRWLPTNGGRAFSAADFAVSWRSTPRASVPVWSARAGAIAASTAAPLAVWPVAGSSDGRGVLLRGHTLFDDGVITSPLLGRALTFGGVEYSRPVYLTPYGGLAVAGFVDAARSAGRMASLDGTPWHVDVGAGLRIASPGAGGLVRVDVAYGLRDGAHKLSAGYVLPWGR